MTPSIDRTLHQFLTITDLDLITEFDFLPIVQGFHGTYATGAACQQRTLTPPDTWSCPTLGLACVLMSRPISPELVLSPDFWISNTPRYFSFAWLIFAKHRLFEIQLTVYSALSSLNHLGMYYIALFKIWLLPIFHIPYIHFQKELRKVTSPKSYTVHNEFSTPTLISHKLCEINFCIFCICSRHAFWLLQSAKYSLHGILCKQ